MAFFFQLKKENPLSWRYKQFFESDKSERHKNGYYSFGLLISGINDHALKTNYAHNKRRFNKGAELQNKEFSDRS